MISITSKLTIHRNDNSGLTRSTVKEIICVVMCAIRSTTGISFSAGNNLLMLGFFVIYLQSFKDVHHCRIRVLLKGRIREI